MRPWIIALVLGLSLIAVACNSSNNSNSITVDTATLTLLENAINYGFAGEGVVMWEMPDGSRCAALKGRTGYTWIIANNATSGTRWYGYIVDYDDGSCFPPNLSVGQWSTKRWNVVN